MARSETRTVWITEDGQEWDSKDAASAHEAEQQIVAWLDAGDIYWRDTDASEVVKRLLEGYKVTPLAVATQG